MSIHSITACILGLGTFILTMISLMYPYWFQQTYRLDGSDAKKGFGLWSAQSSSDITTEMGFAAPNENLRYSELCENDFVFSAGSWLKTESEFQRVLCEGGMKAVQILFCMGVTSAFIAWLGTIAAVIYKPPGWAEKIVSGATLVGSIVTTVALMVWAIDIQTKLTNIPLINDELSLCNAPSSGGEDWSCWFYGTSFWIALGSTLAFSLTGYCSSHARKAKEAQSRKQELQLEAHNVQVALAESLEVEQYHQLEQATASEVAQVQHPAVADSDHHYYEGLTDHQPQSTATSIATV